MDLLFLNLDPLGDYFGFTGGVILGLLWNCIWSQVYALKCEPPAFYLFLVYIPITYVAFAFGGILLNKSTYLFQHNNVASSIILLTYVGAKWLFVFFSSNFNWFWSICNFLSYQHSYVTCWHNYIAFQNIYLPNVDMFDRKINCP